MISTRWSLGLSGLILGMLIGLFWGASIELCGANYDTGKSQENRNHESKPPEPPFVRPTPYLKGHYYQCAAYDELHQFLKPSALFINTGGPRFTDWVIAIATATYVGVATVQFMAIRRQANIAAASIRPWVSTGDYYSVNWITAQDGRYYMHITNQLTNTGKSPALRAEYYTEIRELITNPNNPPFYDPPEGKDWMVKRAGPLPIFPEQLTGGIMDDYPFTPSKHEEIMTAQRFIVFVTWIDYEDTYRGRHHTQSCHVYDRATQHFVPCFKGNEAT